MGGLCTPTEALKFMRNPARRLRAAIAMRSTRMRMKAQLAWYWRWGIAAVLITLAALLAYWVFQNQHRITGFNPSQMRTQLEETSAENARLRDDLAATKKTLAEHDQQAQIDRAAQAELSKTLTQLQEENATLKEDLGFLRNIMGSSNTPEGIAINNVKVDREANGTDYRYRLLLTQGGQRKQDFKGRVQILARVTRNGAPATLAFPDDATARGAAASPTDVDFRYYQKVDGRFTLPPDATLKAVEVRILSVPGGQVRLSRVQTIG
jgi:hypothetical protein